MNDFSIVYVSSISRIILLLAFKSLTSYALSHGNNLICCTLATANKYSLPDADDHRLLAEHTRVDFSLRARHRKPLYMSSSLSIFLYLSLSLSHSAWANTWSVDWVWNFNALVTYSTNTTERPVEGATGWRRDKAIVS